MFVPKVVWGTSPHLTFFHIFFFTKVLLRRLLGFYLIGWRRRFQQPRLVVGKNSRNWFNISKFRALFQGYKGSTHSVFRHIEAKILLNYYIDPPRQCYSINYWNKIVFLSLSLNNPKLPHFIQYLHHSFFFFFAKSTGTVEYANCISSGGKIFALGNAEYPFIGISLWSSLTLSGSTRLGPTYGSNRTKLHTYAKLNW